MSALYVIAGIVAVAVALYLVWALFKPEDFS